MSLRASHSLQLGAVAHDRVVVTRSVTCSLHARLMRAKRPAWIVLSDASCGA